MAEKSVNIGAQLLPAPPTPGDDTTRPLDLNVADDVEPRHVTGIKLWLVLASVTLVAFLMLLDMSIIVTAIPKITDDFHSLSDVGWYGSAFLLAKYV